MNTLVRLSGQALTAQANITANDYNKYTYY